MIATIKNELMIVGFSALFFKVFCNSTNFLNHDWFFSLEFSDVLIPFFVFCSCVIGLGLVGLAATQCGIWTRACDRSLDELLDEFLDIKYISLAIFFAPFNLVIDQMEFRIFTVIFCELYRISSALPFADYVTLVFEKYILSLIEKQPLDWFILMVMLLLTVSFRNWLNGLPSYGQSVSVLAVITRYYVVSALRASDVEVSALGYIDFLRTRTSRENSAKVLTTEDLKSSFESGQSAAPRCLLDQIKSFLSSTSEDDRSKRYENTDESLNSAEKGSSQTVDEVSPTEEKLQLSPCGPDKESIPSLSIQKQHQQTTASKNSNQNKLTKFWKAFSIFNKPNLSLIVPYRESAGPPSQPSRPSPPLLKKMQRGKFRSFPGSRRNIQLNSRNIAGDMAMVAARKRLISHVFLFSSPGVYFQFVKSLMGATATYLAFWCVNFASISQHEWK
eukprot:gene35945-46677_t